jgi:integrase
MKIKQVYDGVWRYDFHYNGKRYRQTFAGISKEQVRSKCIDRLSELRKIKYGLAEIEPSNPIKFEDFAKVYLENYAVDKKSKKTDEYHIAQLKKMFGSRDIKSISFDLVEAYRKKRRTEVSTATVNREIACMSVILSYAVMKDKLAKHPFRGKLKSLKEDPKERRILTDDEIDSLYAVARESDSPFLESFIKIGLNTGMRPSEILALRRRDIDYVHKIICVEESKTDRGNQKGRKIPMNAELAQAIQHIKRKSEYLFFNKKTRSHVKGIKSGFMKACRDAKIEGVTPYCLRHTVATKLVNELGVDIVTAGRILGHKKIEMTLRYCHPNEKTIQRAVEKLGSVWSKKWTQKEIEQDTLSSVTQVNTVN